MCLYDYAECIGGDRNFENKWNELHQSNDIKTTERLLRDGYYIDQWTDTGFQTPLWKAVHANNVEMVGFLVLNGSRRRIRSLVKRIKRKIQILSICIDGQYEN